MHAVEFAGLYRHRHCVRRAVEQRPRTWRMLIARRRPSAGSFWLVFFKRSAHRWRASGQTQFVRQGLAFFGQASNSFILRMFYSILDHVRCPHAGSSFAGVFFHWFRY